MTDIEDVSTCDGDCHFNRVEKSKRDRDRDRELRKKSLPTSNDTEAVISRYEDNIDQITESIQKRLRDASRNTDEYWVVCYVWWDRTPGFAQFIMSEEYQKQHGKTGYVVKGNLESAILKACDLIDTEASDYEDAYIHQWVSDSNDLLEEYITYTLENDPSANIMELFSLEGIIDFAYIEFLKTFSDEYSELYFEKVKLI